MSEQEFMEKAREQYQKIQGLKGETSFYEYEKKFDELWVEFGRATLEKSISALPEDRRKKKVESRYGKIEINKKHVWAECSNFRITPYMQELALYAGQEDNFNPASEGLQKYLRTGVGSSQIDRLVKHYGAALEEQGQGPEPRSSEALRKRVSSLSESAKGYVMMDGCMLLTRQKGEWREMKLGRMFTSGDHYEVSKNRNWIKESIYTAHFGDHEAFLEKLEPLVDEYEKLGERLIFVNDGAKWIWGWASENYPLAIQILDFFHAAEYLAEFAKAVFKNKEKRRGWISGQKLLLLNDKVEKVIENASAMECRTEGQKEARKKLQT